MKAFLMHRDRDFDPMQLFGRRDRELRHSRGYGREEVNKELDLKQLLPWNEGALRQDLGLETVFTAMARDDRFLFEVAQVAMLRSLHNPAEIMYRQQILIDSLANPKTIRKIYALAVQAIEAERKNYWGMLNRHPSGILHRAVEVLGSFVHVLKQLRAVADSCAHSFSSEGFSRFFAMLKDELSDEYFSTIEGHLRALTFKDGTLISVQLSAGNKGTNYVLRKPYADSRGWLRRLLEKPEGFTFVLHPRDEGGARALSALNDTGVNLVANALARSTDHVLSFFQMLRTELAFYIGCLNLKAMLDRIDTINCIPVPTAPGERSLSFQNMYDISLALNLGRKVIGNDLNANGKDMIVVTGANTGGKSTFLRSLGLALLMMQAGMFTPAETFSAEVCDSLITHYKREEDSTMESGKWDEELSRMSGIVDKVKPNSMVLFNESFASTNEREGSEIAEKIVRGLLDAGVRVAFVTHLYHFAHSFFREKEDCVVFLRAERFPDGTRPFKLVEAPPLQTSYGEDLYRSIFLRSADQGQPGFHRTGGD
jgi:hypothetical protein